MYIYNKFVYNRITTPPMQKGRGLHILVTNGNVMVFSKKIALHDYVSIFIFISLIVSTYHGALPLDYCYSSNVRCIIILNFKDVSEVFLIK